MERQITTISISIVVNLCLVGLKFLLAGASGSLSLRASAWHSLSDVIVSGVVLVGLVLARYDRRKVRGISRVEHVVSLIIAVLILYMGWDIFREVATGEAVELRNVVWVAIAAVLTIVLSLLLSRYKMYVGKATDSPSLVADGYHSLMDMYSSIVVVASLLGYSIGFRSLDKVAAVVVVVFIALAGYEIIRGAVAGLRGADGAPGHDHSKAGSQAGGRGLMRRAAPLLLPILLAAYGLSGLYSVKAGHVAVVRRFGKLVAADVPPGLHYRLPWPLDGVTMVPVDAVQRVELPRSLMLTGDQNLVNVSARVHYRVRVVVPYVFGISEPAELVRVAAESALRQTVGGEPVDDLLTTDRDRIQRDTRDRLQGQLDRGDSGLEVLTVQLVEASPPPDVASAFLDVASAREDRSTYINEALAYRNELLPKALGEAEKLVREAEGYKAEKVANATGEAGRFSSRLTEYRKAAGVTRTRLYLETMEKALPGVQKVLLSPGIDSGDVDLWLSRGGALALPPGP